MDGVGCVSMDHGAYVCIMQKSGRSPCHVKSNSAFFSLHHYSFQCPDVTKIASQLVQKYSESTRSLVGITGSNIDLHFEPFKSTKDFTSIILCSHLSVI